VLGLWLRRLHPTPPAYVSDVWRPCLGGRANGRDRALDPVSAGLNGTTLAGVAQPLRTPAEDEAPPIDPVAVDRNYRFERARRRVRDERRRASRRANRRFWFVMLALLVACVVLAVTVWNEIERLFGL
jgi:hypothetical protein